MPTAAVMHALSPHGHDESHPFDRWSPARWPLQLATPPPLSTIRAPVNTPPRPCVVKSSQHVLLCVAVSCLLVSCAGTATTLLLFIRTRGAIDTGVTATHDVVVGDPTATGLATDAPMAGASQTPTAVVEFIAFNLTHPTRALGQASYKSCLQSILSLSVVARVVVEVVDTVVTVSVPTADCVERSDDMLEAINTPGFSDVLERCLGIPTDVASRGCVYEFRIMETRRGSAARHPSSL